MCNLASVIRKWKNQERFRTTWASSNHLISGLPTLFNISTNYENLNIFKKLIFYRKANKIKQILIKMSQFLHKR